MPVIAGFAGPCYGIDTLAIHFRLGVLRYTMSCPPCVDPIGISVNALATGNPDPELPVPTSRGTVLNRDSPPRSDAVTHGHHLVGNIFGESAQARSFDCARRPRIPVYNYEDGSAIARNGHGASSRP
jgi:hypothetical protein